MRVQILFQGPASVESIENISLSFNLQKSAKASMPEEVNKQGKEECNAEEGGEVRTIGLQWGEAVEAWMGG